MPTVNSWCLRYIKYTFFAVLRLCHNAREKKHVWNSLFSWSFNLKRFRWLFLSFVRFSFPFISAVPFDLNEFFQDILHWIGMVWIIRFFNLFLSVCLILLLNFKWIYLMSRNDWTTFALEVLHLAFDLLWSNNYLWIENEQGVLDWFLNFKFQIFVGFEWQFSHGNLRHIALSIGVIWIFNTNQIGLYCRPCD